MKVVFSLPLALFLVAQAAHAQPSQTPARSVASFSTPPTTKTEGYRYQMLAVDAASLAILLANDGNDELAYLGGYGLFLGASAVHLLNHQPGHALGSVALRVGAPLVTMYLSEKHCSEPDSWDCLGDMGVSLDYIVLGEKEVKVDPSLQPIIHVSQNGGVMGLGGTF